MSNFEFINNEVTSNDICFSLHYQDCEWLTLLRYSLDTFHCKIILCHFKSKLTAAETNTC